MQPSLIILPKEPKEPQPARNRSDAERLDEIEGKLLLVAKATDGNTAVMIGGMQTMDTRLAMLFLVCEDIMKSLPISPDNLKVRLSGEGQIDLTYYAERAEEALKASDPLPEPEPEVVEPATDAEEVATYFGGKP